MLLPCIQVSIFSITNLLHYYLGHKVFKIFPFNFRQNRFAFNWKCISELLLVVNKDIFVLLSFYI